MAFRILPNAARYALDGMIAAAHANATLAQLVAMIDLDPLRSQLAVA